MSTASTKPRSISLEDISKRKAEIKMEIETQRERIFESTRELFAPEPAESGMASYMQAFNKGLAIYDGAMTGIKIMRKVRQFFSKKKEK